ncbi:MAG: phosphoenolpyruvate--protein phosphotransferase [Elusimicrobiota bacterium]|nr:phosphoenolpyruvate--protein phosphotransferase [Endomicrobiia bacterium]MDW8164976.1 phosphoenolpyruvate--protein phosphotransferase [Elusimicrobiota bacterium]
MKKEKVLNGIAACEGIAIGKVFLLEQGENLFFIPIKKISKEDIKKEITRYKEALELTKKQLIATKERILKALGKQHADLIEAYVSILEDKLFTRDVIRMVEEQEVSIEYALSNALNRIIQMFEMSDDEYFKGRSTDIHDVGRKLFRNIIGKERKSLEKAKPGSIIIAHTLNPHDVIILKEKNCRGFVIEVGTKTSHVSIVSQGLGIPSIVGLRGITSEDIEDDDEVIIDAFKGMVILNPSAETKKKYNEMHRRLLEEKKMLTSLITFSSETIDHKKIGLVCNIDTPKEVESVLAVAAEGIGLYRTEYQYIDRTSLPSEDELFNDYKYVAERMYPYPVTIRTFDIGSDKLSKLGLEGVIPENVPALGLRGIRLAFKYRDVFKAQIRAILRASYRGNVKIMFPLVSCIKEVEEINKIVNEVKSELTKEDIYFDKNILIGVMIETPSAALICDIISQKVDFVSIGTNDLIQFTLAVDRHNENVADLYEPLHLSILRMIKNIVEASHSNKKPVSICGEMAADVGFTKILIGLGIDEISVPPSSVLKIKRVIRSTSLSEAKSLVEEIFSANDYRRIEEIIKKERHKI